MRQLYQVAAGAYAAVFVYNRANVFVDKGNQQIHHIAVYARVTLYKAAQPGNHQSFTKLRRDGFTTAGSVAANEVILQLQHILLVDLILRHRTETGIDAVDELVRGEFF